MLRSVDKILTTHAGRLERPGALTQAMEKSSGGRPEEQEFHEALTEAVVEVVTNQKELGIDVVNDGEFGKISWNSYIYSRLSGHSLVPLDPTLERSGRTSGGLTPERRQFEAFYKALESKGSHHAHQSSGKRNPDGMVWACTGPVTYVGRDALDEDLRNLRLAVDKAGALEAFVPSTSPINPRANRFFDSDWDYYIAVGEAMRTEYKAIIDAGFIVQIDDPHLTVVNSDDEDLSAFRRRAERHVEIVNHAIKGLPEDRLRYHVCWGSWHGPHTDDVSLRSFVDLLLTINVQAYVLEAANARHEHEWQVWKEQRLPSHKMVIPGVVSHATNVVEHPELVAWRISNFASVLGRENIIAGTDCGLGYRVHPQIANAKLKALCEGARLASNALW